MRVETRLLTGNESNMAWRRRIPTDLSGSHAEAVKPAGKWKLAFIIAATVVILAVLTGAQYN